MFFYTFIARALQYYFYISNSEIFLKCFGNLKAVIIFIVKVHYLIASAASEVVVVICVGVVSFCFAISLDDMNKADFGEFRKRSIYGIKGYFRKDSFDSSEDILRVGMIFGFHQLLVYSGSLGGYAQAVLF